MHTFPNIPTAIALMTGLGLLVAPVPPARAQTPADTTQAATLMPDSTLVSDLASYRDEVRRAALLVSQQPEVLSQLARQQTDSRQAFDSLVVSYGKRKQGWFYDVARFPTVLHQLAALPHRADKSAGRTITQTLPPPSQMSAWRLYRHHHDDLVRADRLNQQADQRFDSLIAPLDGPTQTAFRRLLTTPDALLLLAQAIDQTTRLGQAYLADSAGITQQLATLHDSLSAQDQRELANYQRELNDDPLAQQELQQAGLSYAQANRLNTGLNPDPADSSYYDQNPYSFWSGYPGGYNAPGWYPSSWWYSTGFHFGSGGSLVPSRLPSAGFCNWFFRRAYRTYPHLYNRFNNCYARTIDAHRYRTRGNSGFMAVAHRTFGPRSDSFGGGNNWLTGPRRYSRSNSGSRSTSRVWSSGARYRSASTRSYHPSFRSSSFSHVRSFSSGHHSSGTHHSSGSRHSGGSRGGHR